jgi:hypothetical protein
MSVARAPHDRTEALMLDGAVGFLRCPQCAKGGSLTMVGRTLRCGTGHSFDIARSGYVNLLPAGRNQGDTAAMVAARDAFLSAGHFAGLAAALAEASAASRWEGCVADVGAGTGYYLAAVLDRLPGRGRYFELDAATEYRTTMPLDHRAVGSLVTMGPSSWHTEPGELAASIAGLPDPVLVTVAVQLASYRPRR